MKNNIQIAPPNWPLKLLRRFLRESYREEIEGDMLERFYDNMERYGTKKAKRLYICDSFKLIRPALMKKRGRNVRLNHYGMLKHNLMITFRNFKRYKASFLINLVGLSTGLAAVLLIYLWVNDELSFDKFHENDKRLYQVMRNIVRSQGEITTRNSNSDLLAPALAQEMPEIEYIASVSRTISRGILSFEDKAIKADGQYAGKDFFKIFSYNLIQGKDHQVLQDKYAMVISEDIAFKLYGSPENAMGQMINWKHDTFGGFHTVSGVFQKPAHNTSETFDFVAPHKLFMEKSPMDISWGSNPVLTYLTLRQGVDAKRFNDKISDFIKTKNERSKEKLFLRPYSDRYLFDHYENGKQAGGRINYVILFSTIALFILIIACINFMNLSTARASRRSKEVGIKQVVGARRLTLIFQYTGEAILITFISLLVAVLLVLLFLPKFNLITDKHLTIALDWNMISSAIIITLITGFVSGSYPALYLSGFKPVRALKGRQSTSASELWTRQGFVILQFCISILLIVSVIVLHKQIKFVQSQNLGYTKDNVITFERQGRLNESLTSFLDESKNIPGVVNSTVTRGSLTNNHGQSGGHTWEGKPSNIPGIVLSGETVGYEFIETLGIDMKEGRSFSRELSNEEEVKIILNEKAVEAMGLTDPIGKWVSLWGTKREIIGIVKNFHFQSLYEEIKPLFLLCNPDRSTTIVIKIHAGTEKATLSKLEKLHSKYNPGIPFDFRFLDDDYQSLYRSEQKVADLSQGFAGIAILISCLGLFGLAAFTAERRSKEIGIRKILGSSVLGIVYLLSGDFTKMVLAAVFITLPLSHILAENWLAGFAYHIDMEWWVFAGSGVLAILIAWLTVALQTIKAATSNPVDSLRNE